MANFRATEDLTIEEGLNLYQKSVEQAQAALAQNGFASPNLPTYQTQAGVTPYRGELPGDITSMTDDQLGYVMGRLSEWNAYVQFKLAEADAHLTAAKAEVAMVEASLRILYRVDEEQKKRSNPERDDYVNRDRRFVSVKAVELYWDHMWRYTKAVAMGAENSFATVSRRITQRGQEIERERRNMGVSAGTNLAPGPLFAAAGPRR